MRTRALLRAVSLSGLLAALTSPVFAQATPPMPHPRKAAAPVGGDVVVDPWGNLSDAAEAGAKPAVVAEAAAERPPLAVAADPGESPLERARRQVVVLQRAGKPLGMGSVLAGDGRILTALSILGHGNDVEARFADGSVSEARVVHSDRGWDLALVAPANKRSDGLRASRATASKEAKLGAFSPGAKTFGSSVVRVKQEATLLGGDGAPLDRALVLDSKHKGSELGSPVIDERGDVVAILAQACTGPTDKPCTLGTYAAPVGAIKEFLRSVAPSTTVPPLGLRVMAHDAGAVKGLRVLSVAPRSRLARARLRPGVDTIVAVNGSPVASPEALYAALRVAGSNMRLLVYGGGRFRTVSLAGERTPAGGRRPGPIRRWPSPRRPLPRNDPGY